MGSHHNGIVGFGVRIPVAPFFKGLREIASPRRSNPHVPPLPESDQSSRPRGRRRSRRPAQGRRRPRRRRLRSPRLPRTATRRRSASRPGLAHRTLRRRPSRRGHPRLRRRRAGCERPPRRRREGSRRLGQLRLRSRNGRFLPSRRGPPRRSRPRRRQRRRGRRPWRAKSVGGSRNSSTTPSADGRRCWPSCAPLYWSASATPNAGGCCSSAGRNGNGWKGCGATERTRFGSNGFRNCARRARNRRIRYNTLLPEFASRAPLRVAAKRPPDAVERGFTCTVESRSSVSRPATPPPWGWSCGASSDRARSSTTSASPSARPASSRSPSTSPCIGRSAG